MTFSSLVATAEKVKCLSQFYSSDTVYLEIESDSTGSGFGPTRQPTLLLPVLLNSWVQIVPGPPAWVQFNQLEADPCRLDFS